MWFQNKSESYEIKKFLTSKVQMVIVSTGVLKLNKEISSFELITLARNKTQGSYLAHYVVHCSHFVYTAKSCTKINSSSSTCVCLFGMETHTKILKTH